MAAPGIVSKNPAPDASDVAVNSLVEVVFDQAMNAATLTSMTVLLYTVVAGSTSVVTSNVSYHGPTRKVTLEPTSYLDTDTVYEVLLYGWQIENALGEAMVTAPTWSFTTSSTTTPDPSGSTIPPETSGSITVTPEEQLTVLDVEPDNYDWKVPQNQTVIVEFSDDLWMEDVGIDAGLPSGAYDDPQGWLEGSIEVQAIPSLGEEYAGFTPTTPEITVTHIPGDNSIQIVPDSSGYIGSTYQGGSYKAGTLTDNRWEPMTDYIFTLKKNRLGGLNSTPLTPDYVFFFTTLLDPMYSSIQVIRMALGELISSVPDNTIALIIHRNSIEAQTLGGVTDPPQKYVRDYVTCKTSLDLLTTIYLGIGTLGSGRRTLGDMSITKDAGGTREVVEPLRKQLMQCVAANEALIKTGGKGVRPTTVVPSYWDPRFPGMDDTWSRMNVIDPMRGKVKPSTTRRSDPTYPFMRPVRTTR